MTATEDLGAVALSHDLVERQTTPHCDSVEDLPEALVSESIINLAKICMRSAVRLAVTSKLLYSLFYGVLSSDTELSAQLLARQENYDAARSTQDPRSAKVYKALSFLIVVIMRALFSFGTLFLCCCGAVVALCIYILIPIIRGMSVPAASVPVAPWLFPSLVMGYTLGLVWVETGVTVGRMLRPRDRDLICMVRWFLLLPFIETVGLFVISAFCNQALMTEDNQTFIAGFVAPQLLMSLTMYAQFFAFLTWARADAVQDMHVTSRVRVLHLCHIISLSSLAAYVFFYYQRLLQEASFSDDGSRQTVSR